jgi:RHS repeat-associated protein
LAEFEDGGLVATYVHGPGIDEPLIMKRGSTEYQYQADNLGSIREVLERPSGAVKHRYEYGVFGSTHLEDLSGGQLENPFAYTGREWERYWLTNGSTSAEKSLYYYRARYYDPAIGRFLSEDPIGFDGGDVNLYTYVGNRPLTVTDPTGLQSIPYPVIQGAIRVCGYLIGGLLALAWGKEIAEDLTHKDPNRQFDDCDVQYENDLAVCRRLRSRACYEQAMARYAACLAGKPLPPFPYKMPKGGPRPPRPPRPPR